MLCHHMQLLGPFSSVLRRQLTLDILSYQMHVAEVRFGNIHQEKTTDF